MKKQLGDKLAAGVRNVKQQQQQPLPAKPETQSANPIPREVPAPRLPSRRVWPD